MIRRFGLVAALILTGAGSTWAQTPPTGEDGQEPPPSTLEDVVVSGRTLDERVATFVDEVAQPVRRRGLARWARPACFGVVNFDRNAARYIADRLVARADELGLPAGDPDCDPNVFVIGTVDAPDLARAWVARNPDVFRPRFSGSAGGRNALERFVATDAAVRWWHVSLPVNFDVFRSETSPAVRMPGEPPPKIQVYSRSLQPSRVRDDLLKVLVLVDVGKTDAVTADQLCDYLLMVAYAQIDPDGDTADYETILNLFRDASVPGLTEWDRGYLGALYGADSERRATLVDLRDGLADELRPGEIYPDE